MSRSLRPTLVIALCSLALFATLLPLVQRQPKTVRWDSALEDWFEETFLFI